MPTIVIQIIGVVVVIGLNIVWFWSLFEIFKRLGYVLFGKMTIFGISYDENKLSYEEQSDLYKVCSDIDKSKYVAKTYGHYYEHKFESTKKILEKNGFMFVPVCKGRFSDSCESCKSRCNEYLKGYWILWGIGKIGWREK